MRDRPEAEARPKSRPMGRGGGAETRRRGGGGGERAERAASREWRRGERPSEWVGARVGPWVSWVGWGEGGCAWRVGERADGEEGGGRQGQGVRVTEPGT